MALDSTCILDLVLLPERYWPAECTVGLHAHHLTGLHFEHRTGLILCDADMTLNDFDVTGAVGGDVHLNLGATNAANGPRRSRHLHIIGGLPCNFARDEPEYALGDPGGDLPDVGTWVI